MKALEAQSHIAASKKKATGLLDSRMVSFFGLFGSSVGLEVRRLEAEETLPLSSTTAITAFAIIAIGKHETPTQPKHKVSFRIFTSDTFIDHCRSSTNTRTEVLCLEPSILVDSLPRTCEELYPNHAVA